MNHIHWVFLSLNFILKFGELGNSNASKPKLDSSALIQDICISEAVLVSVSAAKLGMVRPNFAVNGTRVGRPYKTKILHQAECVVWAS